MCLGSKLTTWKSVGLLQNHLWIRKTNPLIYLFVSRDQNVCTFEHPKNMPLILLKHIDNIKQSNYLVWFLVAVLASSNRGNSRTLTEPDLGRCFSDIYALKKIAFAEQSLITLKIITRPVIVHTMHVLWPQGTKDGNDCESVVRQWPRINIYRYVQGLCGSLLALLYLPHKSAPTMYSSTIRSWQLPNRLMMATVCTPRGDCAFHA